MEHSKTPWKIGTPPPNGEQTIGTTDGLMVAVATAGAGVSSEANARRIVACINACAGLSTELLEKAALTAAHIEARERLSFCTQKIEEERDELLAAVKELVDQNDNGICGVSKPCWSRARAVIQKVRGGE